MTKRSRADRRQRYKAALHKLAARARRRERLASAWYIGGELVRLGGIIAGWVVFWMACGFASDAAFSSPHGPPEPEGTVPTFHEFYPVHHECRPGLCESVCQSGFWTKRTTRFGQVAWFCCLEQER